MARWKVEYLGADKKPQRTYVTVGDEFTTALKVQEAIGNGEIADLYIDSSRIVLVQKDEGFGGGGLQPRRG